VNPRTAHGGTTGRALWNAGQWEMDVENAVGMTLDTIAVELAYSW
jgi:hypothetical protein